jgi:hypothetical protein
MKTEKITKTKNNDVFYYYNFFKKMEAMSIINF